MSDHSAYISPFSTRYASKDMQFIFSEDNKFRTWRKLWVALAKAEKAQGLAITDEQIAELEAHQDDINYEDAQRRERECRHDVMSHVYAYGLQCPKAKGILHLGATSCYVGDNTDVIIMKQGLQLIRRKVLNVLDKLAKFADEYKAMPCLAYTHIQPAQLTTVGKRATLWMNELYMDYLELEHRLDSLALLGSKGTTGTQASFMELFGGDEEKIRQLERDIAQQMGFDRVVPVSARWTISWFPLFPALLRRPANSATIFGFCRASRRWRNPLKSSRSVPRPCPTSAIPCVPNVFRP